MQFLSDEPVFPDPADAGFSGLVAVGGDLSAPRLLAAYRSGIFPWYRKEGLIYWYCPYHRMVLFPQEVKVSHSMKQVLHAKKFTVTVDAAFSEVIQSCAQVHHRQDGDTWIDDEFISAYQKMFDLGHAHSVEVWYGSTLAGGLYGIAIGKVFCGESMFSTVSNASKVALIHLCRSGSYQLIDCQVPNNHLLNMGARQLSRPEFLAMLKKICA